MTLIAAGQNTRNRAMLGLQAMSQEEAEREALYQQMRQAQKAQNAQLAGTGLGIGGSYLANNPEVVKGAATSIGQKLGLIQAPQAGGFFSTTGGGAALAQSANAASAGATAGNAATVSGFFSPTGAGAALAQGANAAGVAGGATAGAGTAAAGAGAGAGAAAGTAGATAGTAAGAAGSLAPLAAMAGPLAIGLGAFFLLNKLFD